MTSNRKASEGVGGCLRADMRRAELTSRGLAKALAGAGGTQEEIERVRRQVARWRSLTGSRGMTPDEAAQVAEILGTDPERYRSPIYDERQELERKIRRLETELRRARDELARLR
jgi:hypothetical protein